MKISLDNKLEFLYQWDIDRKVIITGAALDQEVHFATKDLDEALVVKPKEENGSLTCNIPNILLQDSKDIIIYLYDGHKTFFSKTYKIIARKKPADYVYNETEILTYEKLAKELKEMIATRANGIDYSNNKLSLYSDGKEIASTNIVTDDYRPLQHKPSINDITLEGNKSLEELGIQPAGEYVVDENYVHTDNNYTSEEKEKLASLENYNDTGIRDIINGLNDSKQDTLVSGQNIKTINNESILGSGNFELLKSPIDWHIDEIDIKEPGWYYYTKDTRDNTNIILTNDDGSEALYSGFNDVKYAVGCKIYNYELDEYGSLTNNPIGATVLYFTSNPDDDNSYQPGNNIGMMKFNKINGSWEQNDNLELSLGSLFYNDKMIISLLQEAASDQKAGRIVTTKGPDEVTGMNTFNTSGIGKGLKLENQELSVNAEGLDISKATVEDGVAGINKTELISLVKDNLQIKSVSTGLKFENGVLSLDIANGDNLKYGTSK